MDLSRRFAQTLTQNTICVRGYSPRVERRPASGGLGHSPRWEFRMENGGDERPSSQTCDAEEFTAKDARKCRD